MFKDKKFTIPFIIGIILPWLVLAFGIPAVNYFSLGSQNYNNGQPGPEYYQAKEMFDLFYGLAMGTGLVVVIIESVIAITAFIWMIVNICRKNKERFCIVKPLILWLCPNFFVFGTLLLMLLVQGFTYGQGV